MTVADAGCGLERRREDVRGSTLLGLDYVEVGPDQTVLDVYFLGRAPEELADASVAISGGRPVRIIGVTVTRQKDPTLDDWMEVRLDRPGDFATYTLSLVALDDKGRPTDAPLAGMDPRYAGVEFSFKASCPSDQDCCVPAVCPPPDRPHPDINYLAKDYGSFRQLILDRLAQTMPDWRETHVPDIGIMLVELLAYAGDQLSYYQDAVATEAYLGTARQRISVRRHARLVDYMMHEGCNARAWVAVNADADITLDLAGLFFTTDFPDAPTGGVVQYAEFAKAPAGSFEVFEPVAVGASQVTFRAAHNTINFYTWGDCACCLPKGATSAALLDAWVPGDGTPGRALNLKPDDVLIFEEVIGPHTGNPADADPRHRQAVRLTRVTQTIDPLYDTEQGGRPVVEIEWCPEDALTFPLCLSAVMPAPDCTCCDGISVARGNVVLVDSGMTVGEPLGSVPTESSVDVCPTDCSPAETVLTPGRFRPVLQGAPLTWAQDLPPCGCASAIIVQDPRQSRPQIALTGTVTTAQGPVSTTWTACADLLGSEPDDTCFVVETDDDGRSHIRFGNGDEGMQPAAATAFTARYRIGNGPSGNVGAETIVKLVFRQQTGGVTLTPRNPLPATGGTAPEAVEDVRMFAPTAFRDVIERAITTDDYASLAADNARRLAERSRLFSVGGALPPPISDGGDPRRHFEEEPGEAPTLPPDICTIPFRRLQNAKGSLRWNGSWYEVNVAVDPLGGETAPEELLAELEAYLEPYRRIGHDLDVEAAQYVALDLGLSVCVKPGYLRGDVAGALRGALGTGVLANGKRGLFNPDSLTFGQGVYVSPIVAAAQSIPGVIEVEVTRLARFVPGTAPPGSTPDQVPVGGVLPLGPFEIARLDNDPNAPLNGRLTIRLRGGR